MYDPFLPPRPEHIRATPNAVDPRPVMPQLNQQPMPTIAERPDRVQQPQFGQPGFQPPSQWADEWAQYNSPGFQQTLMQSPYFQRHDARNDRQQLRQDARDLRQPNALGPITPPGPGNLPPNPQGNPALPPQPLPPQGIAVGEPYPQYPQYPQYGKLWG